MTFGAEEWLIALLAVPLLWLLLRVGDRRARRRLDLLLGARASEHLEQLHPRERQLRRFLLLLGVFWLVLALSRPQWGAHEVTVRELGTDVVIALDVSRSMLAEDVPPSRLERAKGELETFLAGLPKGRVGIVLFAGAAFVQCPLTLDYATADLFLRMADTDMISAQGTDIGSALATSRRLLAEGGGGDALQAILLVTDGEDLEGRWQEETQRCRQQGIVLLPVGVGQQTGGLIPVSDQHGRPAGFLKDEQGNVVMTRLDLASLEKMAAQTSGQVFRMGGDPTAPGLYDAVARLGERELVERRVSSYEERFAIPLLLAFLCLLGQALLGPWRGVLGGRRHRPAARAVALALPLLLLLAVWSGPAAADTPLRPPGAAEAEAGRRSYATGHYEEALRSFQTARALNPDDPRLSLAIGETLHQLERHDEAMTEFQRALGRASSDELSAECLYNEGTTSLAAGDVQKAAGLLRESLTREPGRQDALHNLELALRRLAASPPQGQQGQDDQQGERGQDGKQGGRNRQGDQQPQDRPSDEDQQKGQDQQSQQGQQGDQRQGPQDRSSDRQGQQQKQRAGGQDDQDRQQQQQQTRQASDRADSLQTSRQEPRPEPQPGTERDGAAQEDEKQDQADGASAKGADDRSTYDDSPAAASIDTTGAGEDQGEQMSRQRALQILRALDRDEQELRRSVQRRLEGKGSGSGKQW